MAQNKKEENQDMNNNELLRGLMEDNCLADSRIAELLEAMEQYE